MLSHFSPGASGIGPDLALGQQPVLAWWASAQARICSTTRGGRSWTLRAPRRSASRRASDEPPGRPRSPL